MAHGPRPRFCPHPNLNVQDGGGGSLRDPKIRLLWQAAEILLRSLKCRFLVRHGSNTSFETGAPL